MLLRRARCGRRDGDPAGPARAQGCSAGRQRGRAGPTLQSDHRLRDQPITAGEHVHVHNLGMADFVKDYAYGVDAKPTDYVSEPATFQESSVPTDAWRRATTSAFSHP